MPLLYKNSTHALIYMEHKCTTFYPHCLFIPWYGMSDGICQPVRPLIRPMSLSESMPQHVLQSSLYSVLHQLSCVAIVPEDCPSVATTAGIWSARGVTFVE